MFLMVALESFMALLTPRTSPEMSVRSEASIATSVPVPMAMPTSACAGAGAKLAIARDHGHFQAYVLQRLDRLPRLLPHRICDRHDTCRFAVDGDEDRRLAFARKPLEFL